MQNYITLTNSEIAERISEIIHSKRDREIMRLKLIDGLTLEQTAEIVDMSVAQIQRIVKHYKKLICK
jgi:DNA-directed RNA polymerase specialized sigma subunit